MVRQSSVTVRTLLLLISFLRVAGEVLHHFTSWLLRPRAWRLESLLSTGLQHLAARIEATWACLVARICQRH